MANYILAGVGNIDLYNQGDLIATSKTLTESSISVEDNRRGCSWWTVQSTIGTLFP